MNDTPVSKILVLDNSPEYAPRTKQFCDENNLVPLKVRSDSVMSVLRTNIDLGGILCAEGYGGSARQTHEVAAKIHSERPELPIFLRRESSATLADLPEQIRRIYCGAYTGSGIAELRKAVDEYIFCMMYPNALLRGIAEITQSVLINQCKTLSVSLDTPYIVRDRVIFGELFSLIQLESAWCRGYMMLQTEEGPFIELLGKHCHGGATVGFRDVNDLLSETTNLIWGSFKNRYIGDGRTASQVQVPLIVNHKHRYISFGTEQPQLCFRYTLAEPASGISTTLYARFVFNLSWSPHDFKEVPQEVAGLVESGALEMF